MTLFQRHLATLFFAAALAYGVGTGIAARVSSITINHQLRIEGAAQLYFENLERLKPLADVNAKLQIQIPTQFAGGAHVDGTVHLSQDPR